MPRGNLPVETSSLVGRRREVAEVKRLLGTVRLVTLTGPGGVGKTRVALRAARDLIPAFAAGCWLVSLSDLDDPELLAPAVCDVLGVRDQTVCPQVEVLVGFLRERQLLLVLDTCERLVEACADLAERLLRAAPRLRILTTSREALRIAGEHMVVIPPLTTTSPILSGATPSTVDVTTGPAHPVVHPDAMELFRVRAAAVLPGFELTAGNLATVASLCHRLEGIPLAIELAAGRLRALSVEQITARLDDRFQLLAGGHTPVWRHQALRTAIDWSYQLCDPAEQVLWARLAVFAGSFDPAAVEKVCADEQLTAGTISDRLTALVEKSIVFREPGTDPYRFRMLDTIRDYGAERLCERGEQGTMRRRHRDHYRWLVRRAEHAWAGRGQLRWSVRLKQEHANIRAALEYCLSEPAGTVAGQDLAGRLWFFWVACGFLREGRHYLDQVLVRDAGTPEELSRADLVPAGSVGAGSMSAGLLPGDRRSRERCRALWACAYVAGGQGDLDTADMLARQCRADAITLGDGLLHAYAVETQGMVAAIRGDLDTALSLLTEALSYYRGLDKLDVGMVRTLPSLGIVLVMRGEFDAALEPARECRALCAARGELWQRSYADYLMALALRGKGELAPAAVHVRAAIEVKHRFHDIVGLVMCVELLAGITVDTGDGERAARLLGAAREIWQMFGLPAFGTGFHSAEHQRCAGRARALLGESGYEACFRAGRALDLDQMVEYALGGHRSPHLTPLLTAATPATPLTVPSPGVPTRTAPLTPRETEIVHLVAEGLSNRQIAAQLVIAKRTADSHVEHILAKLGFSSRAQIAAWAVTSRRNAAADGGQ